MTIEWVIFHVNLVPPVLCFAFKFFFPKEASTKLFTVIELTYIILVLLWDVGMVLYAFGNLEQELYDIAILGLLMGIFPGVLLSFSTIFD